KRCLLGCPRTAPTSKPDMAVAAWALFLESVGRDSEAAIWACSLVDVPLNQRLRKQDASPSDYSYQNSQAHPLPAGSKAASAALPLRDRSFLDCCPSLELAALQPLACKDSAVAVAVAASIWRFLFNSPSLRTRHILLSR